MFIGLGEARLDLFEHHLPVQLLIDGQHDLGHTAPCMGSQNSEALHAHEAVTRKGVPVVLPQPHGRMRQECKQLAVGDLLDITLHRAVLKDR